MSQSPTLISSGSTPSSSPAPSASSTKKRGVPIFTQSIPRGAACLTCRYRKLKCSGGPGVCTACAKGRKISGVSDADYPCQYEELGPGAKRRRVSSKQITTLEQKLAELQAQFEKLAPRPEAVSIALDPPPTTSVPTHHSPSSNRPSSFFLLPTGYPSTLPPFPVLHTLVTRLLSSPHPATTLFDAPRLLSRIALPPLHPDFPHESLLQAIVALTADVYGDEELLSETPLKFHYGDMSPMRWHYRRFNEAFDKAVEKGEKLFDALQGASLGCHYLHRNCEFNLIWTHTGNTVRLGVGLGLHKLPPPGVPPPLRRFPLKSSNISWKSILRPPKDEIEEHERRVAMWWAFCGDKIAAANTGWASSLQDSDMDTWLPARTKDSGSGEKEWRALSPKSPDFFRVHPPALVGELQLCFKANVLIGRAVQIPSRCSVFGHTVKPPPPDVTTDTIRAAVGFVELERDIDAFITSTSFLPSEHEPGVMWPAAFCFPLVARILLHEQICSTVEGDVSMMRCLDAATRILTTVVAADDPKACHEILPFLGFCWAVAGRTFVRALSIKEAWGDLHGAPELRRKVNFIIDSLNSYNTLHGQNVVAVLQTLLDNPMVCLPQLHSSKFKPNAHQRTFHDNTAALHATAASLRLLHAEQRALSQQNAKAALESIASDVSLIRSAPVPFEWDSVAG